MPIPATETTVMHAYRNHQRDGRRFGDAVFGLAWLFGGLVVVAIGESFFGDSLRLLVVSAPVLFVWMAPFYAHFFRRYYEIRLSDEGSCEFRGALRSKHLRAQQIISVQRNASRICRSEDDEAEHTLLRFQGGSLVVVQPVDGFEDFLTRLQALNPAIDVTGVPDDARPSLEAPATEEPGTFVQRFFRSALFPLLVIVLILYLASR
jgi:hypothetical protein